MLRSPTMSLWAFDVSAYADCVTAKLAKIGWTQLVLCTQTFECAANWKGAGAMLATWNLVLRNAALRNMAVEHLFVFSSLPP